MMNYLSLFSGMEAAHLAWAPLGWHCKGVAEIDRSACSVLRHRLPHVPNLGSVTDITDEAIAKLGRLDVVIGGSPCQDLSIAGKRAGLAGSRSSLFHHQMRIFHAALTFCGARWLVWENVPGAFSSNAGRDFAVVVGEMAGCELSVPREGWGNEGVALGDHGLVEWSVLDAQWFGVAQRRRRVFAVLDTGNWASRSPVLLEPESLRGDSAPRREAWPGSAGGVEEGAGEGRQWPAEVASTLNAAFGDKLGLEDQHALNGAPLFVPEITNALTAHNEHRNEVADMVNALIAFDTTQVTSPGNRSNPKPNDPCHPLTASGDAPAVAFSHQAGGVQTTLGYDPESGTAPTLSVGQTPAVHADHRVRRLTPRECERLQGAEDDWTLVPTDSGKPMKDGPRYKMLGNSFAVPVIRWIGERIENASRESAA